MTSISLGTTSDCSAFNIAGGNQVNQYFYPPPIAGDDLTTSMSETVRFRPDIEGISWAKVISPSDITDRRPSSPSREPVNNAPIDILSVHFTGRGKELDFLQTALSKSYNGAPSRCAVHGMPGLGKTQLLLRYAKVSFDRHQYARVFWISATSVDKLNQGFSGILDLIKHPDRYLQDQNAKLTSARLWLEQSPEDDRGDWLLVFDNVHRETLSFLRVHLPLRNDRGNILFSTRTADVAESLAKAGGEEHPILGLQALGLQETADLLFKDAGIDATFVLPSLLVQAKELVGRVGRLPLAVVQAASYMKQTYTTLDHMLELYKNDRKIEAIQWENDLTLYEARSVAGTFENQLNELNQRSRNVGNLLKLLSFLDPENVPVEMLVNGAKAQLRHRPEQDPSLLKDKEGRETQHTIGRADGITSPSPSHLSPELDSLVSLILSPIEFQMAIQKLQNLSLVERRAHNGVPSLWIHDLIQFMVRDGAKKEGTYQEWLQSSWSLVYEKFRLIEDTSLPQWWADCEKFIPHLQSLNDAWSDVRGTNLEVTEANYRIAGYLKSRGRYDEAESLYKQVLEARKEHLGTGHADTLATMNDLADTYLLRGRYSDSETLFKLTLVGREKYLGNEHPNTLTTVTGLALVYTSQGLYDKAEALHKRALDGREKRFGTDHRDTLMSMNDLAFVNLSQGRYKESEALLKRALDGREKYLGANHSDTFTSLNSLGFVYSWQGRLDEAEGLHKRALEGFENRLGTNHPYTLASVNDLAFVNSLQGRYVEAEARYKRVLKGFEKHLGSDHPNTLTTVNDLAFVHASQGRYDQAEILHKQALEGREKYLGTNHPDTLASINDLGLFYSSQGHYHEAEKLHQRALEGYENHFGPNSNHLNTLTSMNNLAFVISSQGRHGEAEELHIRALDGREKQLGSNHPDTLTSVNNLALVYSSLGRFDEAEALYKRALDGRTNHLGPEHPNTFTSLNDLASFYSSQGRYDEAEKLHQQALEGREKKLGADHPDTLASMRNLASVYSSQGRQGEAEELLKKSSSKPQ